MILLGSTARADVQPTARRPGHPALSSLSAAGFAMPPRQAAWENLRLRVRLARERRALRAAHRARHAWGHRRPKVARGSTPAPPPPSTVSAPAPSTGYSADWYAIAACESGGVWSINSGNGYWGGLQFSPGTWFAYGGGAFDGSGPFPYSAGQQIAVAERILAAQGPGAWPNCFQ